MNDFCPIEKQTEHTPNKLALFYENKKWTYLECHNEITTIAKNLQKKLIITLGEKTPSFIFLFFAALRKKIPIFPISTRLPIQEVEKLKRYQQNLPDIATLLQTSGTTAQPKIVCHSLSNHLYSAYGSNASLNLNSTCKWLLTLPLYHIGGIAILFRVFLAGGTLIIPTQKHHRFDQITHLSFVPTQLYRLLKEQQTPSSLKAILLGGAPIPPSLYQNGLKANYPLIPTYGMTEMSSQVTALNPQSPFSLGHLLPHRELKIDNKGEIHVRGKTLFQGYLIDDKNLNKPFDHEGWFATGDLGTFSLEEGLKVIGRKDRQFISGGENIQPEEIEEMILQIPGMIEVHVIPKQDDEFGFRPIVYYQCTQKYSDEFLKETLEKSLPRFKIPMAFLHQKTK